MRSLPGRLRAIALAALSTLSLTAAGLVSVSVDPASAAESSSESTPGVSAGAVDSAMDFTADDEGLEPLADPSPEDEGPQSGQPQSGDDEEDEGEETETPDREDEDSELLLEEEAPEAAVSGQAGVAGASNRPEDNPDGSGTEGEIVPTVTSTLSPEGTLASGEKRTFVIEYTNPNK